MALHIGIGNFAGAIASNIFRTQDAPRYVLGRMSSPNNHNKILELLTAMLILDGLELMFVGIGFICTPIAIVAYRRINAKRDAELLANGGVSKYTAEQTRELGDRAPDFRYTL